MTELEAIVERGIELNQELNYPNLDIIKKMNIHIEKFLKNTPDTIVYGGYAIETLLASKKIDLKPTKKIIDYDFYTPNYKRDSVALANILYNNNFKYVRRINAINPDTFRIGAEFAPDFLSDITFIPEKAFKNMKYITINGINYADPQYLKIDLYTSITRPHTNTFRWKKSYKRLYYLEKVFPLKAPKTYKFSQSKSKIKKEIENYIQSHTKLLATGLLAFNLYTGLVAKKQVPIDCYEFYAIDPDEEIKKITKFLKMSVSIKKFYPYLNLLPRSYVIYDNEVPIIILYEIGFDCIGSRTIKDINIINYHYLLRFFYVKYNIMKDKQKYYAYIIQNLYDAFEKYNTKHSLDGLERDNPFQIFQTTCLSTDADGASLIAAKRTFYNIPVPQNYKPENKYIDAKDIIDEYHENFMGEEIVEENIIDKLVSFEPERIEEIDEKILKSFENNPIEQVN